MSGIDQIREMLKAGFDCDQPVYLLVDPLAGELAPELAFSEEDDAQTIRSRRQDALALPVFPVELPADLPLSPWHHPYLVVLPSVEHGWMDVSLEIAQTENRSTWINGMVGTGWGVNRIGGWLQTAMAGERLADMLADWMRLNTVCRTQARYLRLADSRVLSLLIHLLGRDSLLARMGRLRRWAFIDARGQPDALHNPAAGEAESAFLPLPQLDQLQWQHLQDGPLIHGAIAMAVGERAKEGSQAGYPITGLPYAEAIAAIARDEAQSLADTGTSCRTREERCTAIALTLLHPGWAGNPKVRAFLVDNTETHSLADHGQDIRDILK